MDFVFSPSNLKTFVQCPYKFKAMNVDKTVPYVQNEAAKRGERLHSLMETAVNLGWDAVAKDYNDEKSHDNAYKFIQTVWGLKKQGWIVKTETEFATDGYGNPVGYWDKAPQNFLRCRIDLWAVHPDKATTIILDWKTGKAYDADRLQLQANAVCMKAQFKTDKYMVAFCYLDSGAVKSEEIDVHGINLFESDPLKFASSPCIELMNAVDDARRAFAENKFIKTKNRFCKWCAVKDCEYAGK